MEIVPRLRFCNTFQMEIAPTAGFILLLIDCINVNQQTRNRMNGSTEMKNVKILQKEWKELKSSKIQTIEKFHIFQFILKCHISQFVRGYDCNVPKYTCNYLVHFENRYTLLLIHVQMWNFKALKGVSGWSSICKC